MRFDELTETQATALVNPPEDFEERVDFVYRGEHHRGGKGFVGPTTAAERSETETAALRSGVARRFTSENVVGETARRARDVVAGKEPYWTAELMRPLSDEEKEDADRIPKEERARMDEAESAMGEWWDRRQGIAPVPSAASATSATAVTWERRRASVHDVVKAFVLGLRTFGRAGLRLRVRTDEMGKVRAATPTAALRHVFAECILPDVGRLYLDADTMEELGIISYVAPDEIDTSKKVRYTELTFLAEETGVAPAGQTEGEPKTTLRILRSDRQDAEEMTFDLRGHLLYYEAGLEPTVTVQMLELQKALNTEATEMGIVLDQEGFAEVILFNTLGPGDWKEDPDNPSQKKFHPTPYSRGPGQRSFFMGEPETDAAGKLTYTNPSAFQLQAADVEGYLKGMQARRLAMLRQARQVWTEITDDAAASGESRVQALVDFLEEARSAKGVVDAALKWLLETAWFLALDLSGAPGRDHDLRFVADCKISIPFIPAALRDALLRERQAGLRSDETTMTDLGIEDVAAELARIAESEAQKLNRRKTQGEILGTVRSVLPLSSALSFAMLTKEEQKEYAQTDRVPVIGGDGQ